MPIVISALETMPEVHPNDDLALLIQAAAQRERQNINKRTVVIVAQKVVSKAEGAIVRLSEIVPSEFAKTWASQWSKDARVVELALQQSRRVVRMDAGRLITETHQGLVIANSGVDLSNAPGADSATILPIDPDRSAARLWAALECGAVIVSDTVGRPWRKGVLNVAIGIAGMKPRTDGLGSSDRNGRATHSVCARADELAAAAGLLMSKQSGTPVVLIEGATWVAESGSSKDLLRPAQKELFR